MTWKRSHRTQTVSPSSAPETSPLPKLFLGPSNRALHLTIAGGRALRALPLALAAECQYVGRTAGVPDRRPAPHRPLDASHLAGLDTQVTELLDALQSAITRTAASPTAQAVARPSQNRVARALSKITSLPPPSAEAERAANSRDIPTLFGRTTLLVADLERESVRIRRCIAQEHRNASEWERRAMLAVKCQDDGLARETLARKAEHDHLALAHIHNADALDRHVVQLSEMLALATKLIPR